jgi:plasmid stabilization system protein ParE
LIEYSPRASRQVSDLILHYRRKRRPDAARNLERALARAEAALLRGILRPRLYPATYRSLAHPGTAWLKESGYWIGYKQTQPPAIIAVFWEQADIDRRYKPGT